MGTFITMQFITAVFVGGAKYLNKFLNHLVIYQTLVTVITG